MQRTPVKLRWEELQVTKVIMAAPSKETSERRVRKNDYERALVGMAMFSTRAKWRSFIECMQ
jgi:hypothetical protein